MECFFCVRHTSEECLPKQVIDAVWVMPDHVSVFGVLPWQKCVWFASAILFWQWCCLLRATFHAHTLFDIVKGYYKPHGTQQTIMQRLLLQHVYAEIFATLCARSMLIPVCCFKSMSLSAARPCGRCSSFHCFCRWWPYIHDTDCLWSVRKHASLMTRLNVARPDIDWQRWTAVSRLLACLMFEWSFTATA